MKYLRQPASVRASIWTPPYPGSTRFTTKRNETMERNARYVAMMEGQMKLWEAEVDSLAAEGDKLALDARLAYADKIRDLRGSRDAARSGHAVGHFLDDDGTLVVPVEHRRIGEHQRRPWPGPWPG